MLVMSVPALLPLAQTGYPYTGDGILHLFRAALLDYHIRHGVLYPRWLPELMLGQGYPVLGYYAPSMYYLAELFVLPGFSVDTGLAIACGLAVILAAMGAYLLARDLFGDGGAWPAALVAAVAYAYSPYLMTNLYVRGAIAEFGANALLPWVFWTFRRLVTGSRPDRYLLPASLALAGLAITHNITLLLVPPGLVAYVLIIWRQHSRLSARLIWAACALAAAMAISAWFWAPLIGERSYLSTGAYQSSQDILGGQYWTWSNFLQLRPIFEYHADPPFQLGLVQLVLAAAGAVLVLRRGSEWLFFIAVAFVAGIFAASWAAPIWSHSQLMLVVQFPWRMLTLISLPLALLTGALLLPFRRRGLQAAAGAALLAIILMSNYPRTGDFQAAIPERSDIGLPVIAQAEPELSPGTTYSREFHPRWLDEPDGDGATEPQPLSGQITVQSAGSYRLEFSVDSETGGALRLPQLYFPGWRARIDGFAAPLYASSPQALATVDVAPGRHAVSFVWEGTGLQRWAGITSVAGLLALMVYCIATKAFLPGTASGCPGSFRMPRHAYAGGSDGRDRSRSPTVARSAIGWCTVGAGGATRDLHLSLLAHSDATRGTVAHALAIAGRKWSHTGRDRGQTVLQQTRVGWVAGRVAGPGCVPAVASTGSCRRELPVIGCGHARRAIRDRIGPGNAGRACTARAGNRSHPRPGSQGWGCNAVAGV